jgi:hypothetical protein
MIAVRPRKTTVDITGEIHSMIPTDTYRERYDRIDWTDSGQSGAGGVDRTGDGAGRTGAELINQPENGHGATDNG